MTTRSRTTIRRIHEGGSPEGHPSGEGDAVRRLPLRHRRARQRHALRRAAQRHDDQLHRLPRHGRRSGRRWSRPGNARTAVDLLNTSNTPWGPRFDWEGDAALSSTRSMAPDIRWEVPQTIDTVDPGLAALQREVGLRENAAARRQDLGRGAGSPTIAIAAAKLAHDNSNDGLPDLPHLVGDELLRLPSADEGQPARRRRTNSKASPTATSPPTIRRWCATMSSCSASTAR